MTNGSHQDPIKTCPYAEEVGIPDSRAETPVRQQRMDTGLGHAARSPWAERRITSRVLKPMLASASP